MGGDKGMSRGGGVREKRENRRKIRQDGASG